MLRRLETRRHRSIARRETSEFARHFAILRLAFCHAAGAAAGAIPDTVWHQSVAPGVLYLEATRRIADSGEFYWRNGPSMKTNFNEFAGAHLTDTGVHFCVWAPNADAVSVAGNFNDWDAHAHPLSRGDDDRWRGEVEGAGAGALYKFVIRNGDQELWKNDPMARELTNSAGDSIVIDDAQFDWGDDDQFQMAPWNELVIYELHLGTFFGGDNSDTVGSFDDAIERLDHIVGLGINAIELMPVAEFAGDQSWGYNPAFPFAIESDYGGVAGLKRFVKACHEHGLAVLIDVVYNHFGPSDLDLWRFDGWGENDGGGIYFYNDWRAMTPWGSTRPDYGRDEVRRYIRDNALMWLDAYHVDGLRFDMTFYVRSVDDGAEIPEGWSLSQWINDEVRAHFPAALTVAEDLRSNHWITRETGAGGAGFGSQWDEQFVHPVRSVLTVGDDAHRSTDAILAALGFRYNDDPFGRVVYTESHDEVANGKSRVPTEVDEIDQEGYWARKRSVLGACLTMTAPGIPMIFQGQEFLATGHFDDGVKLDWELAPHEEGVTRIYRDLIHHRRKMPALRGHEFDVLHHNPDDKVIAYTRGFGDEQLLVVMHFTNATREAYRIGFPEGGAWRVLFHADSKVYGEDFGDAPVLEVTAESIECQEVAHSAPITIGSYDCLIFGKCR